MTGEPFDCVHKKCTEHKAVAARLESACNKMDLQFRQMEKSIDVAKLEMDRRLEAMNEFREQLTRQATQFAERKTVDLSLDRIGDRIKVIENSVSELKNNLSQRAGALKWINHIITVLIGLAVVLAVWVLTKQ